jgi:hypothetical protein
MWCSCGHAGGRHAARVSAARLAGARARGACGALPAARGGRDGPGRVRKAGRRARHVQLLVRRRKVDGRAGAVVLRPEVGVRVHDLRRGAAASRRQRALASASPRAPRTRQLELLRVAQAHAAVEAIRLEARLRREAARGCAATGKRRSSSQAGARARRSACGAPLAARRARSPHPSCRAAWRRDARRGGGGPGFLFFPWHSWRYSGNAS